MSGCRPNTRAPRRTPHPFRWNWAAAALAVYLVWLAAGNARGDFRENFESPQTSWTFAAADAPYRLHQHGRVNSGAHWGQGCEQLRLETGAGTHVYFSHAIDNPRVHEELSPGVWVKADRPGVQLLARVVFPRAVDAAGQPVTALLQGRTYRQTGGWERLVLEGIPARVARQARVLRLQLGREIDPREAYLDLLILNTYTGAGVVNLMIDDLEIAGHVPYGLVRAQTSPTGNARNTASREHPVRPTIASNEPIELRGAVLIAGGQPVFCRAIEHQGESFQFLRQLGFNAVRMASPPSPSQISAAREFGLWIICPPPDVRAGRSIGAMHDRVIAWDLGDNLRGRDLPAVRELAAAVRRADEQAARPMLAHASEQLRTYSRVADALVLDRQPLGSSIQLDQYSAWLEGRRELLRPGTPIWATIQTEPLAAIAAQWQAMGVQSQPPLEAQQIRLLTYSAIMGGSRALLFRSRSRLDAEDENAKARAQALALINHELELIDPWLAVSGHPNSLRIDEPHMQAALFPTERSHLIVISNISPQSQYATAAPTVDRMTLVVPGIPESSEAYLLSPTGLRPLAHRRVTGGVGINIDEVDWVGAIVFTSDPLVFARLTQTAANSRLRVAELHQQIAQSTFARTQALCDRLADSRRCPATPSRYSRWPRPTSRKQRMVAGGDAQNGYQYALRAEHSLAGLRREIWNAFITDAAPPASDPTLASCETLPLAIGRKQQLASARAQAVLAEGGMEDLNGLMQSGWRHFQRDQPGVGSHVELSTVDPYSGRYALRLEATAGEQALGQVESPPVWIRTRGISVEPGQPYVVRGWARVGQALSGTSDGLLIYDSVAGRDLAMRIEKTDGWRQFELHRVAPRGGVLDVNIELTGTGEAYVDDVEIILLGAPSPTSDQLPNAQARRLRNLFGAPK